MPPFKKALGNSPWMRAWYLGSFVYARGRAAWGNLNEAERGEFAKLMRKAGTRPDRNLSARQRKRLKELVRILAAGPAKK